MDTLISLCKNAYSIIKGILNAQDELKRLRKILAKSLKRTRTLERELKALCEKIERKGL